MSEPGDRSEEDIVWRELVRTNDAVLVSAVQALLDAADIPHLVLDQNMSVLEGSIGILPRRILVDECCIDDARRLLDRGRPGPRASSRWALNVTEDAVLGGRLLLSNPGADIASAMTPFCWRRPARRARASASSISAPASARRDWRWRSALRHRGDAGRGRPGLAALAAENAQVNGLAARVGSPCSMLRRRRARLRRRGSRLNRSARVLMNPPFNDPARQRASPDRQRRLAHAGPRGTLAAWVKTGRAAAASGRHAHADLARGRSRRRAARARCRLRRRSPCCRSIQGGRAGDPRPGAGDKASRAPLALLPGLVLNDDAGVPTAEAEAVLRGGAVLPLSET